MRLLLDTHALAWWLVDSPSLSPRARAAIGDPSNKIWASAVSGHEPVNKQRLGKLKPPIVDRLLMAQARLEELTLVSVDPVFREYGVGTLW